MTEPRPPGAIGEGASGPDQPSPDRPGSDQHGPDRDREDENPVPFSGLRRLAGEARLAGRSLSHLDPLRDRLRGLCGQLALDPERAGVWRAVHDLAGAALALCAGPDPAGPKSDGPKSEGPKSEGRRSDAPNQGAGR